LALDYAIKKLGRYMPRWLRARAVERAKTWMLERFTDSDGLGAIFPPMIYTVISLRCLGYADDSSEMKWALRQLEDLMIEDGDTIFAGWRGAEWDASSRERHEADDRNAYAYSFITLERTGSSGVN